MNGLVSASHDGGFELRAGLVRNRNNHVAGCNERGDPPKIADGEDSRDWDRVELQRISYYEDFGQLGTKVYLLR